MRCRNAARHPVGLGFMPRSHRLDTVVDFALFYRLVNSFMTSNDEALAFMETDTEWEVQESASFRYQLIALQYHLILPIRAEDLKIVLDADHRHGII